MTGPHLLLSAAAVSDIGPHRKSNQDSAFTAPWAAAVADGVGGGPAGDLASAAFVHRLAASGAPVPDGETLATGIRTANWDLRAHVDRDPALHGMATTFTGVFLSGRGSLLLAHTGDSRAYLLRGDRFAQQTRDDSYVQALVELGLVAQEDAAQHPRRNVITASLSGAEDDSAVVIESEAAPGDRWLLCSDGLSDYVPADAIAALATAGLDPHATAAAAVSVALEAGTRDNVTVVVADVVSSAPGADQGAGAGRLTGRPVFYGAASTRFQEELDSA
ncbi:PP2C family protein-serine/threonine phosphatase [Microbacterium hominis]|uniref:Serine/threonine-protein phosphatase n=1 Tax=Microbacterium hominis TaxID=162426 RepID=A0A7D4U4S8_9MICO|nr:protein phosphatase 2C domain-containing protein [Microbacterium hominis]QKJ19645.1 serine/threonine-protein phosphatase [Microbacterium hominis]